MHFLTEGYRQYLKGSIDDFNQLLPSRPDNALQQELLAVRAEQYFSQARVAMDELLSRLPAGIDPVAARQELLRQLYLFREEISPVAA
jgi:hypothetical protein